MFFKAAAPFKKSFYNNHLTELLRPLNFDSKTFFFNVEIFDNNLLTGLLRPLKYCFGNNNLIELLRPLNRD